MQHGIVEQYPGGKNLVRTFVCIEIPRSIQNRIDELRKTFQTIGADVSWVRASNIHLTLKFLGDVPHSRIEAIRSGVSRACHDVEPFELTVSGIGGFPSLRNARVLWIGLPQLPDSLRQMQKNIEDHLRQEGFPGDPRPFSSHLTVARVRSPRNLLPLTEAFSRQGFVPETFQARQVIIMQSQLNPGGSVYTALAVISLSGLKAGIPQREG